MPAFAEPKISLLLTRCKISSYFRRHISMSESNMEAAKAKRQYSLDEISPDEMDNSAIPGIGPKRKKAKVHTDCPVSSGSGKKKLIESKPLENPEIFIENGLRKVRPYWFRYMTSTKGRWEGKRLIDILTVEFHVKNEDYFNDAIKSGRLKVNEKLTSPDYVLGPFDVLTNVVHRHELPVLDRPIKILVNNDDVVVIEKPSSLPVHPCGRYYFKSLTQILKNEYNMASLRLMYRLDRLTSGLVIMSKHSTMDLKLKSEISDRTVQKEYVCVVEGEFPSEPIECSKSIEACEAKMGIQWIAPEGSRAGKECVTKFELIRTNGRISIVRCLPKTGRTHQIRVHLQYLGFPILNDYMYNNIVWEPHKGKGAEYCKSPDQLKKDLMMEFGSQNWVTDFEQSHADFMEHKGKLTASVHNPAFVDVDSITWTENPSSTVYDPYCIDCHVEARMPTEKDLLMYLHCLKYRVRPNYYFYDAA